jgi:hypothetical protein
VHELLEAAAARLTRWIGGVSPMADKGNRTQTKRRASNNRPFHVHPLKTFVIAATPWCLVIFYRIHRVRNSPAAQLALQ